MCGDAPKVTYEDRKLWSYLRPTDPKLTQMSISKAPFQFLTIGRESEWHQAAAFVGNRVYPFSVRSPLILKHDCKDKATVQIRPFRANFVAGASVIGAQPRDSSPAATSVSVAGTDPAQAWLHVVAYDSVPPQWPYARPDVEYQAAKAQLSSTSGVMFACPVMGRRRFSAHFQQNAGDPGVISYRFTGLTAFDDTLREDILLDTTRDTTPTGNSVWSRHLDVDSDAYDWIQVRLQAPDALGASVEALFWVRD